MYLCTLLRTHVHVYLWVPVCACTVLMAVRGTLSVYHLPPSHAYLDSQCSEHSKDGTVTAEQASEAAPERTPGSVQAALLIHICVSEQTWSLSPFHR